MFDPVLVLSEASQIRRGEMPGWEGDPVRNAESYLWRIGEEDPEAALVLAEELRTNGERHAAAADVPASRAEFAANRIRESAKRRLREARKAGTITDDDSR